VDHDGKIKIEQIVYRYDEDPRSDEMVENIDGVSRFLRAGVNVNRNGKEWKVVAANQAFSLNEGKAVRVLRVYLRDDN